jgi:hypothetical protein
MGAHPEQTRLGLDLPDGLQSDVALGWILPTRADEPCRPLDGEQRLELETPGNDFLRQFLRPVKEGSRKPVWISLTTRAILCLPANEDIRDSPGRNLRRSTAYRGQKHRRRFIEHIEHDVSICHRGAVQPVEPIRQRHQFRNDVLNLGRDTVDGGVIRAAP